MAHIFDISGGDLANTVLGHLDLDQIKDSQAVFYGYSDLTTILTALAKNGQPGGQLPAAQLPGQQGFAEERLF